MSCHCEERSDAAIPITVGIASSRHSKLENRCASGVISTVMAGLVPAIGRGTVPLLMAGTSPAMTVEAGFTQGGPAAGGGMKLAMTGCEP
jgi:hypothetical protein